MVYYLKNGLISDKQRCKDHSNDRHRFYQDVECRACGILERVANRIAGDCLAGNRSKPGA